ncbi:opacity protein-like surface antigen [Labrenzia sp. EL_208]|nr:opacity protein-like surface antigen [Labrenzia sp. EL_132]MBG6230751.1 opacity protein-like surface antigen [Labrenzia sp. EL_208]
MKLKGLMLGVAAAATATTAQAADLPVAPEPVDYVRVCDAYGSRFYYIPGTETCLRVGGRLRTQFVVNNVLDNDGRGNWSDRDSEGYSWLTRGYAYLDARNATEFGTLRAYVGLRMDITNGESGFKLDSGYIQWGGLTAGYLGSNFNTYTGQVFMGVVTRDWADTTVNQIAYTAAFGNGFSATLAVEDRSGHEVGSYGGTRMPDFVAALGVSQGWGSAQLSGALHQVYPDAAFNSTNASGDEDSLGWAIGAGVNVNLPFANSGSNIFFQGFYADGALKYIGNGITGVSVVSSTGTTLGSVADYGGNGDKSTGYSLSAGVYIQATPTIGLAVDGSYAHVDQNDFVGTTDADIDRWAIDGSVQWEPVSGFVMGADIGYSNTSADISGQSVNDLDELLFGVRMQRTF